MSALAHVCIWCWEGWMAGILLSPQGGSMFSTDVVGGTGVKAGSARTGVVAVELAIVRHLFSHSDQHTIQFVRKICLKEWNIIRNNHLSWDWIKEHITPIISRIANEHMRIRSIRQFVFPNRSEIWVDTYAGRSITIVTSSFTFDQWCLKKLTPIPSGPCYWAWRTRHVEFPLSYGRHASKRWVHRWLRSEIKEIWITRASLIVIQLLISWNGMIYSPLEWSK